MAISLSISVPIKTTTSLCSLCKKQIPAEVYERSGQVFLKKRCPEHGEFDVLINSDRRFYYESCGAGCACQSVPGHSDRMVETAATCIALIEIVESCNLRCPTCFAESPFSDKESVKALSVEEFWRRIGAVIERKGPLDILQLSGGEPTIHPQFFDLLEGVLTDRRIGYTMLNTNGVRVAKDRAFADRLGELHRKHRHFELYLQFDGPQEAGQVALRGADFRRLREEVLETCGRMGVPVTLAMTVTPENLTHLGESLRLGLAHSGVRGVTFQPMFWSGRTHLVSLGGVRRLNVADIILALIEQGDGLLAEHDFTPLPCGDPNCHTIGYLLRKDGRTLPVSHFVDFSSVQGFLKDRVDFNIEDLQRCGCESEPLGQILKQLEIGPDHVFRIFIKPFMDVWTYDQDRIDQCCVHVVGEDGRLESFCRHYAMRS